MPIVYINLIVLRAQWRTKTLAYIIDTAVNFTGIGSKSI
jgi:hypothetical protein